MEQNSQNGITSISQLPSSNQYSNSIQNIPQNVNMINSTDMNNIIITKNETINESNTQLQPSMQNPHIQNKEIPQGQNNYNELINQLQQASQGC